MSVDSTNSNNKKVCLDCGKELRLYHIRKKTQYRVLESTGRKYPNRKRKKVI
jgi:hypothetical protein